MSELGDKQKLLTRLLPRLWDYMHEMGYEATLGDAYRDPRVFGMIGTSKGYGHKDSNHKRRLAIDINLFRDGVYMDRTEDHRLFGEFWKRQDKACRWGGDFPTPDGNHYSIEYHGQA
jgi:D-alanyl-D-alanine carboxypeptidase